MATGGGSTTDRATEQIRGEIDTIFPSPSIPGCINRRTLLRAIGASTVVGLAGCLGDGEEGLEDDNDDDPGTEPDTDETDETVSDSDETVTETEDDDPEESSDDDPANDDADADDSSDSEGSVTATLQTSKGDIEVELYDERAPRTVDNFVGLATGERTWVDPETGDEVEGEPLYDEVLFHRIIEDFMIQTGDPTGTGRGGPGYEFDDEFHDELRHDEAGILSMANSGPDTNGSQFFITLAPQPHLDGRHSVFGAVIDGMDVVEKIGSVETDENDRPLEEVVLESVTVDDG